MVPCRVEHVQSAAEIGDMMTGGAASGRLLLPTCPQIQPVWEGDAATPSSMMPPVSFQHATPLHLAAYHGHAVVVEMLLHYSAGDIRCKNAQVCGSPSVAQSRCRAVCSHPASGPFGVM